MKSVQISPYRLAFIVCASVMALRANFAGLKYGDPGDFLVLWSAVQWPIDQLYTDMARLPFAYPPTILPLLKPFSLLPFGYAFALWISLGLAAFVYAARKLTDWNTIVLAVLAPAGISVLGAGQTSFYVAALIIGGVVSKDRKIAGVLFGLAAVLKPQSALAIPVALLAVRDREAIIWGALTAFTTVIATAHPDLWLRWLQSFGAFSAEVSARGVTANGVSPSALAFRLGWPGWFAAPFAILGAAAVWLTWRSTDDRLTRYAVLVAAAAAMSPYMLHYDTAGLGLAAIAFLRDPSRRPLLWLGSALTLGYMLAGIGLIILAACFLLYREKSARAPEPLAGRDDRASWPPETDSVRVG